ncbi:MAG: sulfatase [Opitutaceae bacterium]
MPPSLFRIPLLGALLLAPVSPGRAAAPARLNVVLILADDLGWGDLACQGNPHVRTPHLDALAREGLRFTEAYAAAPVCSPARAGLLTGRWPVRTGVVDAIGDAGIKWNTGRRLLPPPNPTRLPLAEVTLAEAFRAAGYATGSIGKWHLGAKGALAEDQGFDVNFSGNQLGSQKSMFGPDYGIGLPPVPAGEYLTDRVQAEAERFIASRGGKPFFLYLSHYAVHRPVDAKPETIRRYPPRGPAPWGLVPEYAAMIEDLDASVGRLRQFLQGEGLLERTILVFTSDNGGVKWWSSNGPLRETKGTLYEGGIRVPLIVRLPEGRHGGRTLSTPVHGADLFPTLLALTATPAPAGVTLDGQDLSPLLHGTGEPPAGRPLFWHYPHYNMHGARPASAVRAGDLKLIEFHEDGRRELYDLRADPGETRDLAATRPGDTARLGALLAGHLRENNARRGTRNPQYTGVEPEILPLRPFESTRTVPGGR